MKKNRTALHSDALSDFLAESGITTEWLVEQCEVLQTDQADAGPVLEILANIVRAGVALPPVAANMVSSVLLELAAGKDARDKRTEHGMVVYLASESPGSVRSRLQAYQKHNDCQVPNFCIVQSRPIARCKTPRVSQTPPWR